MSGTITVYCPTHNCGHIWEEDRRPEDATGGPDGEPAVIREASQHCPICILNLGAEFRTTPAHAQEDPPARQEEYAASR